MLITLGGQNYDFFIIFLDVKIMIFSNFGRSKSRFLVTLGARGPILEAQRPMVRILRVFATKPWGQMEVKMDAFSLFWGVEFFMFFRMLFFSDFFDFRCPEAPFWLPF